MKAAKALKEKGETPEELLRSIKENEAAVAEAQRTVDAWKAIVGEKSRREEAAKAEAERIATEKAEAERKAAEERERAEAEEKARIEAEKKEAERIAAEKAEEEARVEAERKAEEERKTEEEERKERDENGQPFVVSSDGTTTFGEITEDTGLTAAPIKLSEGVADEMGNGYGLRHIEARHGDQIRKAGFSSVEEFIEQVAKNYDVIKEGSDRNGNKTYRLLLTDKHNNTLMIELSKDGSYWNVNTAGVFKKSYGKDKKEVYNRHTTVKQSAETAETSQADEHSGTQSTSRMNVPTTSTGKGSKKPEKKQEKQSVFDKAKEIADKAEKKRKADKPKQKPLTEAERKDAEEVAGALGYRVEWVDTMEGTIDADKKVIRIAKDAENPLVQVLGHEVAHGVKRMDGGKFKALQKAAMEVVGEKEWNERIEKKRKLNAYAEGKLAEEVTCDIVGEALNDKDALKRLAESLRGEKGIIARLRDAMARMVEYFKNRGDKEGVRRMKAADKLLAEFESALKEGVAPEQVKPEGVDRSVREGKKDDKTLYGVHNISEDKLRKAMKLGGLANPSMAVVDKDKGTHEGFGAISLIAPSSLVDKQTGHTAGTWITDAYSQRYPSVERVMSDKGYEKFKSWVDGLDFAEKEKKEIKRQATDAMGNDKDLAWELMYLREKGVDVKGYTSEVDYPWEKIIEEYPSVEDIIKAMDHNAELKETVTKLAKVEITGPVYRAVSADVRRRFKEETGENASPLNPIIRKRTYDIYNRDYAPKLLDENGMPKASDVRKVIGQMVEKYNATKKVDFNKSKSKASTYVHDNGLYADYLKWQEGKLEEFGTQGRIFRGYKNDGTRKYVPETLSNVSKAMKEESQGQTNGSEYTSFGSFIAKLAPRVDSKEEMRGSKSRLDADEAKQEFYEKWESTYYDLATELHSDVFSGEARLHDIVLQSDPKRYAKKEYGITLSPSFLKRLEALKKAIREDLKSAYFETKFERPVMLNEFAAAVVPKGIGDDVRKGLEDAGLVLYEYDPAKKGDRERAANEASASDGIRFNRSEKTELTAEERELRDNLVERMRKGGLDVVTDSEEMQRVIDTENERTRMMGAGSVREHRVYHGSGADFDAFDHSHMGEGEGAQAYGWGTYVTEVEGIGRTYAIQNSKNARVYPVYNGDSHGLSEGRIIEILDVFLDGVSDETYILRAWDDAMQWYSRKNNDYAQSLVRDASLLNPSDISIAGSKTRNLYTVEIPDDNGSNYLDWNSSLSKEQKDTITKALKRLKVDLTYYESRGFSLDDTFADIYYFLTIALRHTRKWEDVNAIRASSKFLYSLGFTGIKYPADNMRGGRKDGAKNYVIFNENDAKITDHVRFLRTAGGEVYGLVKDGRIYLDPKVATAETAVHEYTHLWGDMLRRKDSEQWSHTVKELKNSVLWEEVKELYPELKTDDEIADEVLSTFSGRRGAERLREEARRVADGEGGVFTKAKAIETLERVKEAIARFWEGVARMFGINRYRSVEELADMAMRDLLDSKNPMKDESGMRKRGEVGETLATSGTYFSGGGLLEAGLKGVIDPKVAVEFSEKIAGVYADNHGNHIVVADVRDVDPKKLVGAVDGGEVQYFHASPVCKNFSKAKREGGEVELDKETALSTAEFIAKTRPKVVTIENVKGYRNSEALKIITDELTRQGYDWDADVYNTADYGGYTKRERLIVRAKRDGKLPPKPEKFPEELRKKGWYSAVEDLIPHLEEKKTGVPQGTDERLKNSGIDYRTIDKPLYVFGRGYANKTVGHAFADELLPTLTTGGGDIIIMPDGRVLKASPRVLARVTGLPDSYKMPETDQLSHTIVGNGIPTQLTEGVIAPLLDNAIPSAERATKRESVFDVADRVSQNLEERTRAMRSDEIDRKYPDWLDGTTTDSGRHSTQVEGTRRTYNKVGDWIEKNIGKDAKILDASSGLGYGTADLKKRGFNIEDVEPYQSEERKKNNPATYSSYDDIPKDYDVIISNAVLNVIPDNWRSDVLHNMADHLKPGGIMFINTRKAGEERSIKDKIELDSPQEVLVKRNGKIASYQRFFAPKELKEWVEKELGNGYEVETANDNNSGTKGLAAVVVKKSDADIDRSVREFSPMELSNEDKQRRGDALRKAEPIDVKIKQIVKTKDMSARKAAEKWWKDNVGTSRFYDTEIGLVEINRASVGSSLAHRYSQAKLDAITSLVDGFNNAVYLGSMQDFSRQEGVKNHYFAYPINYNGYRDYVFCRAMQDANKNRLYVHEVFLADNIEKGNTLQTAAFQPHGGITLYKDILANVLTANIGNNSEPSKPRYSRKPGESIFDYASRVSEDVDRSVRERERVSARDEYEKKVKSKGFQTKEALQNSMLGLQEFMSAIDHASGNKRYIEDIPDFENPILGENRLSSVNKEEMHQVAKTQFKPLMSAVAKLSGNGKESGELYDYMFAKHGLERDAVMRQREAQKEFDKYQKANPKGTKTIGDFVASLEGKDYAGLTALTAEDGRVKSIQSQIDAIDEQMKATDDQLLLRKLGGQKKRLKVDLLNAARDAADDIRKAFESNPSHDRSDINELWSRVNEVNGNTLRKLYESGMLTKEAYNDISSMYTNYIPMRGFDQTTSADAYAYLTHGDSAFNAPIKTAKGRSSKADNPIAYMQAMAESAIMQGNRNVLVKQKMLNFVRNHPSDLASVSDVWLQYDSVADEWKPFYAFGRESKGVKRQERGDIFVEYQRCKMHGTYSFWGNQPNSSDLIPRAIIIGKATI